MRMLTMKNMELILKMTPNLTHLSVGELLEEIRKIALYLDEIEQETRVMELCDELQKRHEQYWRGKE